MSSSHAISTFVSFAERLMNVAVAADAAQFVGNSIDHIVGTRKGCRAAADIDHQIIRRQFFGDSSGMLSVHTFFAQ
jgi:hypothetical protein